MRFLIFSFLVLLGLQNSQASEKLFQNNEWNAVLVIPDNPEVNEWYGAQNLAEWAERITGKKIEIVDESEKIPAGRWKIYIGKTQAAVAAQIKLPPIEGDAARREIQDRSIFVIGNNPGATRIAVGRFCEQVLGIIFCQPGPRGADYQILKEISVPGPDLFLPTYRWRSIGGLGNGVSQDWSYLVGYGDRLNFSHNLYKVFTETEWQKNPSFFADNGRGRQRPNGKGNDANPNLNHPGAVDVARHYIQDWFEHNPESLTVSLGINDSMVFDQSALNEGWFRERSVKTNYVVQFLNRVTADNWLNPTKAEGARRMIGILAYMDTLRAPSVKVNPDIFPWICVDRIGYANQAFAEQDIANCQAWVQSGARNVGAYDYWYGSNYCLPRINFTAQRESIQKVSEAGVVGWYAELYPVWAFDAPKAWLGAKLLENPQADADKLLQQWFGATYGMAEKPMRTIYQIIESEWKRESIAEGKNQWLAQSFEERGVDILSDTAIQSIEAEIGKAEKSWANQADLNNREKNQQWRLDHFKETWKLVVDYRKVVHLRQTQPKDASEAITALEQLVQGEKDFYQAQRKFNTRWETVSQKINWAQFTPTNPREKWIKLILTQAQFSTRLAQCVQNDSEGLSRLLFLLQNKQAESVKLSGPKKEQELLKEWVLESNLRQNSERLEAGHLLTFKNQSGVLKFNTKIQPNQIIRFLVRGKSESKKIKCLVQFKGPKRQSNRGELVEAEGSSLWVVSPTWAEEAEFKIQFEDSLDLQEVEINVIKI